MAISIRSGTTDNSIQVGGVDVIKLDGTGIVDGGLINASASDIQARTSTTKLVTPANLQSLLVSGTVVSASGTFVDFTGIPSWAKRVTVMFSGVSTNGTSNPLVQLGDAGGIENTGYGASAIAPITGGSIVGANYTNGFGIASNAAAAIVSGIMTLVNITGNEWVSSHSAGFNTTNAASFGGGNKTLSATLDRIRITTVNGTDTFDAGSINIMWE